MLGVNPRGSSGRGEAFATAIYADWGNKDTEDVLAAVDYAVKQGIADPDRLGVGGWSYGGILTNYVIAKDTRFKSATSGASISNILAGYGTDMYIREYEAELGTPWKNLDMWLRISYPFLHADRIKTPTLFQCGASDFNVPLLNSEQMYQALRSLGVETQLVIYPGPVPRADASPATCASACSATWTGTASICSRRGERHRRADYCLVDLARPSSRSRPARARGCPRADRASPR